MPRAHTSSVTVLAGCLLIAGCSDATVLYNNFVHSRYHPIEFGVGAGRKDLKTVIHGDPFAMGQTDFAAATIDVLNRHQPFLQPTHFATTPGENASPNHRMVLLFNQPIVALYALCREPLPASKADTETSGTLHVAAAFCLNQGVLTSVQGKVDKVDGIEDPKFDLLLGQIVLVLFPPIDPNDDDKPMFLFAGTDPA